MALTPEEEIAKLKSDLAKANAEKAESEKAADKAKADADKVKSDLAKANAELKSVKQTSALPPVPEGAGSEVEVEKEKTYTVNAPPEGTTAWIHRGRHYTENQKIEANSALAKELANAKIITLA